MDLSKIIAISSKPGLYRLISQAKNSFIVEDLSNNKKVSISAQYNVSLLENIAIYTDEKEVPLHTIFANIVKKENGGECIDHKKSSEELRAYMVQVLPNYNKEKVYDSDIKKLFQWYNILLKQKIITLEPETLAVVATDEVAKKETKPKKMKTEKVAVEKPKKESKK